MAILSNVNGKFAVDSTGAIQFSGQTGTSGYVLKSNGNAAPTWVDGSTVIGGPYLPLAGGTLTGATATASGISFTVGGILTTDKILVVKGQNLAHVTSSIIISQESTTKSQIRFYGADASTAGILEFMGTSSNGSVGNARLTLNADGSATFAGDVTLDNILLTPADIPAVNTPSICLRNSNNEVYFQAGSANVFNFIKADYGSILTLDGSTSATFGGDVKIAEASNKGQLFFGTANTDYEIKGGGNYGYLSLNAPILRFDTGGTERMRITSGGDVFIGNSSVTVANTAIFLNKSGIITNVVANSGGTTDLMQFYQQNGGGIGTISRNADGICMNGNGQTNQLVVADSGNVGIGGGAINSPGSVGTFLNITGRNGIGAGTAGIVLKDYDNAAWDIWNSGGILNFRYNNGASGAGNGLSIGTTGTATFAGNTSANAVTARDNMFVGAGQLYIGAENATTVNTFRQAVVSSVFKIQMNEAGTWTDSLRIYDEGRIEPTGGVFLGSSNNSNLLTYYASGTFTPTVTTSQGTSPTITSSSARWQRVGKVVTLSFEFTMDSTASQGAGTVIINNLQVAIADTDHVSGCGVIPVLGKTINVFHYTATNQIGMYFYDGNYCGTAYKTVGTVTYWAAT